jgi:mRNA interferase MazF
MGPFAIRQVVLLPFPFSDLTASKLRPAAITLNEIDFAQGSLQRVSYARTSKIFTAHESLFHRAAGQLSPERHRQVVTAIVALLQAGTVT